MLRTVLVTMPFAAVEYPSLALGLFKSRLREQGISCDVKYLNISFAEMIGWQEYNDLIVRPPALLAAEQLFAHSLFQTQIPTDASYYQYTGVCDATQQRLQQTKGYVLPFLNHCLETVPWQNYDIIGFTSLFEQNLASLSLASRLKRRYPEKILVFGGPNFEGPMGHAFHRSLPFIDYVCSGEADETFPELIKRLSYNHPVGDLPGLVYRKNGQSIYTGQAPLVREMDKLPVPDYDDYFQRIRSSTLMPSVEPCVLLETSRGCWWGEKLHCTFCGLNGQGMKYRSKSSERSLDEILHLLDRYKVRFIRVVDNILNHDYFNDLLPALAKRKLNTQIFYEVKANLRKQQIQMLADARVTIVQAGIESLSTNTLKLMKKGTSSLRNIQTMKWCKQLGVTCDWNVLYGFPGEVPEDYRRNAELAIMLTHLDPPSGCGPIRLDRFSPNFDRADQMGFRNVRPQKIYSFIYPFDAQTLLDLAYYFDFDYKEPIDDGGYTASLNEAIWVWKNRKDQLCGERRGEQLILFDTRPVATVAHLPLTGLAREIYEYCDAMRSFAEIRRFLEQRGVKAEREQVTAILDEFVARRLMVREGNTYLSLAVLAYAPECESAWERQAETLESAAAPPSPAAEQFAILQ